MIGIRDYLLLSEYSWPYGPPPPMKMRRERVGGHPQTPAGRPLHPYFQRSALMLTSIRNTAKRVAKPLVYGSIYYAGRGLRDGGVTILCYHSIDDHDTDLSVPPRLFERHMAILAAEGCRGLTMGQVA